jgi:LPS export ABC transporter protein LptC
MKWQRAARLVLILLAVATIAFVAMTLRKRPKATSAPTVTRVDPKAVAESRDGRLTQLTGMQIPGFIDFENLLTYNDGSLKLVRPKLTTKRAGREFHLRASEGRIANAQSNVDVHGDVVLTANDGLEMKTANASYNSKERVVRAPDRVEFAKGTMRGSGVGMTYDEQRDVVWLKNDVNIVVAPDKKTDDPGAKIVAGAAGLARREHYMRFERSFSLARAGRTISADNGLAYLTDDDKRVKALELRGNSRIVTSGASEGGLQAMSARDMNITYGPDGETIEHAVLAGAGAIQMAGPGGVPGRRISGETIDVTLGDNSEVTALVAHDHVQLTMPADQQTPERTIRSQTMEGSGESGRGLTGATFAKNVEFREVRGPGQLRIAHSQTLTIVLTGGGGVDDARFSGGTRFEDGATTAAAADARYLVSKGRLELTGKIGPKPPEMQDERITVAATKIDMAFEGPKLIATGEVQSVMKPSNKAPAGAAPSTRGGGASAPPAKSAPPVAGAKAPAPRTETKDVKTPGLLKDDQPAYVTGAALDYDGDADKAIYTGGARLWQADTAVTGEKITIDGKTGDLFANGKVRSTFVLDQVDSKTQQTKKVPTIATAEDMHYEDAVRRCTYTTNAHVNGPQGDLQGVKIELYLVEGGGSLERAEAYDDVNLQTDVRHATGKRMTYFAAEERYLMTGAPVRVVEPNCRETTGKTLTFWRSTDRILVDGNEEVRTLSKSSGGSCSQASPK